MLKNKSNIAQQKAAKLAGFALIFSFALVVVSNYSVTFRYIVPNAVETAQNLIHHETAFRFNIFCNLIYFFAIILISTSFYVVLKPINKNYAFIAALTRYVYAFMWALMAINTLYALRILGDATMQSVFNSEQLQIMSKLHLSSSHDAYYVGLPFWGLGSTICSYLLFKSRYVPRVMAVYGIISSFWCVFCGFAYLIFPEYANIVHVGLFDVPLVLFELILGSYLLFKGLKPAIIAQSNLINE